MMPVGWKAQKMQRCWKFPVWTFEGKSALPYSHVLRGQLAGVPRALSVTLSRLATRAFAG